MGIQWKGCGLVGLALLLAFSIVAEPLAPTAEKESPDYKPILAIHAGAGPFPEINESGDREHQHLALVHRALVHGKNLLEAGKPGVDVITEVIQLLENSDLTTAGKGCAQDAKGLVELDASLMDGKTLDVGAVTATTVPQNPILLAREIMKSDRFLHLTGWGADAFAIEKGLFLAPLDHFRSIPPLKRIHRKDSGTVGALVLDKAGNLAAGTSTGGVRVRPGRVGDSGLIGAGTLADNKQGAVSCSGWGEHFIRNRMASKLGHLLLNHPPEEAARIGIETMFERTGGSGGAIVLTPDGKFGSFYNSKYMLHGYVRHGEDHLYSGFRKTLSPKKLKDLSL